MLLVTIQEREGAPRAATSPAAEAEAEPVDESALVRHFKYELKATREDLQSRVEEMGSSNEETMSMIEELQSANEELETTKEELQSMNEKLSTMNRQLQDKINELDKAHNNVTNLHSSNDIASLFLDTNLNIKMFTSRTEELLNLIATDVGRSISDFSTDLSDDALISDCEQVLAKLSPMETEVETDGGQKYLRRILPYHSSDNRIEGVAITYFDISERRKVEEQMRRLATVVIDSNDAITVHDFDGNITAWNRGATQMYGYTETEALTMSIRDLVPENIRDEAIGYIEQIWRKELVDSFESKRVAKDGRVLDVWLTVTVLTDDVGKPVAIATTERDVSQRKKAEQALRASEERVRSILEAVNDAIITTDERGIINGVNPATEQMFGYAEEDLLGEHVRILMPPPYHDEYDGCIARYLEIGAARSIGDSREVTGQRKDGSTFAADLAVSEIDHLGLFTGVIRNISDRKELQKEVLNIAADEQRRIGHELHDNTGQQLTALGMMTQDLADELEAKCLPEASSARKLAVGLEVALNDVRSLCKGLIPLDVDAGGFVDAVRELVLKTNDLHSVECELRCDETVSVENNDTANHLFRIVQEAIGNALKHSQAEHVEVSLKSDGNATTVKVSDDGMGIKEHEKEHGLGLRIMRYRAALVGAALVVNTNEVGGTEITCTLQEDS